jgi:hybrid cluster-associated redox disulfide protein
MKKKFTKDSFLAEILESPGSQEILARYDLPCLTCPFAAMEMEKLKIGEVCQQYGINADKLLEELNGM